MKTILAMGLAAVGLGWGLVWCGPALAGPAAPPPDAPALDAPDEPQPVLAALQLTDAQLARLKNERLKNRRQMVQWRTELEGLQVDLWAAATGDPPNRAEAERLARAIGDVHGRMTAAHAESVMFLRSVLTPDQRRQLDLWHLSNGNPWLPASCADEKSPGMRRHGRR